MSLFPPFDPDRDRREPRRRAFRPIPVRTLVPNVVTLLSLCAGLTAIRLGAEGRFELALCSEDSGLLKPEPEPFRMLAGALGLGVSEILYVGNSRACDLAGARAAGMAVAMVSRSPLAGAELSFFDWAELTAFALA